MNIKSKAATAVSAVKGIEWSNVKRNTILLAWIVAGVVTFSLPFIQWTVQKNEFYKAAGYLVEYENQQNEDNNNNNNNGDDDSYGGVYKECGWWNFVCKRQQVNYASYYMGDNDGNQYDEDGNAVYQFSFPDWYVMLGGQDSEVMMRWKEENTGVRQEENELATTTGEVLVMVYLYSVFVGIFVYGFYVFYSKQPLGMLKISLFFLVQLVLVNVFLLPKIIQADERYFDEAIYGWYGQVGVLMAYFDFWVFIFSAVFLVVVTIEDRKTTAAADKDQEQIDYQMA
jgi:hypothetical protein